MIPIWYMVLILNAGASPPVIAIDDPGRDLHRLRNRAVIAPSCCTDISEIYIKTISATPAGDFPSHS
jgi:hypothetical protein